MISMAETAKEAGVAIVTGDTKVVEKGHGDGVYIATTGIGERLTDHWFPAKQPVPATLCWFPAPSVITA